MEKSRKLITLSGFDGLAKQLKANEYVYIRVRQEQGYKFILCTNAVHFERLVYGVIAGNDLQGFFAMQVAPVAKQNPEGEKSDRGDGVHRPVENLVLACVMRGISAVDLTPIILETA